MLKYANSSREAEGIPEGSIRQIGFKDDDLVTVVGMKADMQSITPERLFGGDRAQLVKNIRTGATISRIVGGVFVLVGFVMMATSVFKFLRG